MIAEFYHAVYTTASCQYCPKPAEWRVFDDKHEYGVVVCTEHKDKFMMGGYDIRRIW